MKVAVFAALFQAVAVTVTNAYPITGTTVNCRSGPGTSYAVKKSYAKGADVKVTCQTTGTSVEGNNIWDKTSDGCYVADYYVKTGTNGYVTTKCDAGGSTGGGSTTIPGPKTNDYPYKGSCGGVDPWNYYKCRMSPFRSQLPQFQNSRYPKNPPQQTNSYPSNRVHFLRRVAH